MQPENPFVGLRPFRSEESLLFFGRRQQTVELLEQLHRTRFLAVVGSSGSGKSSLVSAGLIPRLKGGFLVEDRDRWMFAVLKPGDAPLHSLATAVVAAVEEKVDARGVARQLEEMRACGARAISERLAPALEKSDANFLLLVDQFEELFRFGLHTGSPERRDQAADFVSILLGLAAQHDAPVFVVITMRSDFLGDCDAFHGLPEAMNRSQYLVPRLTRAQRREAVEGPVRLFGERISPQLLDRVLNDAGDEPDQLPIMQHALLRTWENWGKNGAGPLDVADYLATGAMKEALSRDAEAVLAEMSEEERKLAKRIFQALTDTDPGNRRIRRPARLSDLAGVANASRDAVMNVVDRFCGGGRSFLVVSEDPASGDELIDISHESLIRQWETLRTWVDEEAESRRIYLDIVDSVVRKKGLWRDPYLQVALDWRDRARPNDAWARRYHAEFADAMAFLDDSKANRDREALEKLRQQRLRRRLTTALFTVSVVFVAVVAYLVYRAERWEHEAAESVRQAREELARANAEAEEIRRSAQATTSQALAMLRDSEEGAREERFKAGQEHNRLLGLRLGLEASRQFDDSPDGLIRSALVAVESLKADQTVEGAKTLMQALRLIPPAPEVIPNVHKGRIRSLVFSPDGRWLATGGYQDGNVIIWDGKDRKKLFVLETKRSLVLSLAFSADSRWLAAGADRAVFLWNIETGKPLRGPLEHKNVVRSVAFSPDGKFLATTEQAGRLRIFATEAWTALGDTPAEQQPHAVIFFRNNLLLATSQGIYSDGQRVHQGQCHSLAVSGSNIAAACREGIVLLEGSEDRARIPGQYNTVTLFPDGQFVAGDGRIFDVRSREERTRITKPTQSLAFSPDGRHIVTGGPDGALTFWPTDEGTEAIRLPYRGSVTALRFSPDDNLLAAAAADATVRIFKAGLRPTEEPAIKLGGEPSALVFSPDGSMLAAIHKNGLSVRAFGRRMPPFDLAGDFRTVVFSPKGETLYAWEPARIRRFSTSGWKERKALPDHLPEEMRFSPDGRWLAVDYEVRSTTRRQVHRVKHVWDLTNAKVVAATGEEHAPDPSGVIRLLHESDSWERGVASGPVLSTPDGHWKADLNRYSKTVELQHGDGLVAKLEHDGDLRALALSPNGRWMATAATDQLIRLWPLQAADLIERACQILPRNLSEKEWKEARLEGGYRKTCPNLP